MHDNVCLFAVLELQTFLDSKKPTNVTGEMRAAGTSVKKRRTTTSTSMEENSSTPDLQLSLSPNVGGDADMVKKRKIDLISNELRKQKVDGDKMLPLSLSLSVRGGNSGSGEGSGADAGRFEAATGSSSKKAATVGRNTLDLTMSIKALE